MVGSLELETLAAPRATAGGRCAGAGLSRQAPGFRHEGERAARMDQRRQIGRLERDLARLTAAAFGRVELEYRVPGAGGEPRVLGIEDLERVRDALAARVADARQALAEREELEAENRELLRRMLVEPAAHKWARISRHDVGEPGCGGWHSRPVLGPLGMLMGWWRVKVSSGCPLAGRLAAVER